MPYVATSTQTIEVLWGATPGQEGAWWCDWAAMSLDATQSAPTTAAGLTKGTLPVVVVPAPVAGKVNALLHLKVRNGDANPQSLTIRLHDAANVYDVLVPMLGAGETLVFDTQNGWYTMTGLGERKITAPTVLNETPGTIDVGNFPTIQTITGNVAADTELPQAAPLADGSPAGPTTTTVGAVNLLTHGATLEMQRAIYPGMVSNGVGVPAVGLMGQLDDTDSVAVTEDSFAPFRLSSRRAMLVEGLAGGVPLSISVDQLSGAALSPPTAVTDGMAAGTVQQVAAVPLLSNGNSYDPERGNVLLPLLINVTRTANYLSPLLTNHNGRGLTVYFYITVVPPDPAGEGLQLVLLGVDAFGVPYLLYSDDNFIAATGSYMFEFYPGVPEGPGGSSVRMRKSFPVARDFYLEIVHGDAQPYTYYVSYALTR